MRVYQVGNLPEDMDLESPDLMSSVALKVEKTRKLHRRLMPCPRIAKNGYDLLCYHETEYNEKKNVNMLTSSKWAGGIKCIIPEAIRHSSQVVDLNELEPICFKDMTVNRVHKGKYLLCRVVFIPYHQKAYLTTVIEDTKGQAETLIVSYLTRDYSLDPEDLLPMYSIIVIKEPYLTNGATLDDWTYVHVESPTDLVIISDMDYKEEFKKYLPREWIKECDSEFSDSNDTYESLNAKGNKCFVEAHHHKAVRYYTRALNWMIKRQRSTGRETKKTLNNRSMANLKLDRFWPAYEDALRASEIVMNDKREERQMNEKSYYRMAKAMYSMRQFADSVIWFTKCVELNPENQEACVELARAKQRVKESETGEFDVGQIIKDALVNGKQRLDIGDYMSPDLEVTSLNNDPSFKGIVAKTDIKRNTLIMGTGYGSIAYENECDKYPIYSGNIVAETGMSGIAKPWQTQNMFYLAHRVQYDPFFAKKINALYAGLNIDRNKPITEFIVDTERLERIVIKNSFTSDQEIKKPFVRSCSLWIYPSFFNHSCLPNVQYYMFADTILLYTMRDVKKGEELTVTYSGLGYTNRQEVFKSYGFKCTCQLCQVNDNDPKVNTRAEFVEKRTVELIDGLKRVKKPDPELAEAFVAKVRGMYPAGYEPSLQLDLIEPLSLLACYLNASGHWNESAEMHRQIFEQFKKTSHSNAFNALVHIAEIYLLNSQQQKATECIKEAKEYCIGHGEIFLHLLDEQLPNDV